ncbi:MAG: GntR family transcriptional regulator [Firmicutes bacterium]|jgi:GntR family transcriptional regulator|nr:GntR family transcriptional regulator [Bacillota bacterium]
MNLFYLDHRSPIPIYVQLQNQVKQAIAGGVLQAGDQLPSVRELARRLTVNPNTIARAYQELEREGLIETRRGLGTFVAEAQALTQSARRLRISDAIDELLREAMRLGLNRQELDDILAERLAAIFKDGEKRGLDEDACH